jgi:hypothetical protein
LIEQVERVGKAISQSQERKNSSKITSIRNSGTMTWVNTATSQDA